MAVNTTSIEGIKAASQPKTNTAKTLTQAEIDAATAKVVAAGGKSTDPANRLPGESASAANARITAGYKEMLAKPVLSTEAKDAGASVQFVRVGSGGQGEYTVVTPVGYQGPDIKTTDWTAGIIPSTGKYTSGTTLGVMSDGKGGYTTVGGTPPTTNKTTTNTTATGNTNKTVVSRVTNADGTVTITYSDGTKETTGVPNAGNANPDRPTGTPPAYVYNATTGKWEMPPKPTGAGSWVWDNLKGWTNTTVNPGSSGATTEGGPTLALNTFKNTLALFFGANEMSQAWVDALYKSVSNFYNSGSTIDESLNLSLQDVRNNPTLKPFTDRFKGIYALQDRLAAGEAVSVPTIAEYFKTEEAMGDVLRNVGLGDLAKQDFLGDILGKGKSLLEVTNLIDTVFNAIDNAPEALKTDLQTYFPGVDRTSLAKALLTGKEGWAELDKKVKGISVLSAAKSQGITVDLPTASDLALLGTDYAGALSGFQQVKELERGRFLGQTQGIDLTQQETIGATFKKDAAALAKLEKIRQGEYAKFSGSSGRLASRERGSAGLF
jgi:hypothetical protein